jgi:hypothetical protein
MMDMIYKYELRLPFECLPNLMTFDVTLVSQCHIVCHNVSFFINYPIIVLTIYFFIFLFVTVWRCDSVV